MGNFAANEIVVVSGLPRSGTSMMMRMIVAGGVAALADDNRAADPDNPLGYFELGAVKGSAQDTAWVARAPGRVVKVVHALLRYLPEGQRYAVVMMHRDLDEVVASQRTMLERSGKAGASISPEALKRVFAAQMDEAARWLDARPWFRRLDVEYARVIADPAREARRVADFLGLGTAAAMAAGVEPSLYRNKRPAS